MNFIFDSLTTISIGKLLFLECILQIFFLIFYMVRLRPVVLPLTLLYTIFDRKGITFVYLLLTNDTPFTYKVQNFASLLTAVNAPSLKRKLINHKTRTFCQLFHSHKMHVSPFRPFYRQKKTYFAPLQQVKSLSYTNKQNVPEA